MAKAKTETDAITIPELRQGIASLRIIGTTPMFQNRMANKARLSLFVGSKKKTAAEKVVIKHAPFDEYRNSAEMMAVGPTALGLRVIAVKSAMCTAALETAGITKSSAQRLIFMPGDLVPLYGTPQLRLDVVRSADINRTPDIRSRCYLPRWGAEVEIRYITPQLSVQSIVALLSNAGITVGVGDFRQEKGKGAFGSFRVIGAGQDDDEWDDLVSAHGRIAQTAALREPEFANAETAELMAAFEEETKRRASGEVVDMTAAGRRRTAKAATG